MHTHNSVQTRAAQRAEPTPDVAPRTGGGTTPRELRCLAHETKTNGGQRTAALCPVPDDTWLGPRPGPAPTRGWLPRAADPEKAPPGVN